MNIPKISIITVCFNAQTHIEQTIRSICAQNYPSLEYIVIDGGSTDRTLEVLRKYSDAIHVLVSEPDRGISDAFNKGILRATGDIVGIVSADDYLLPDVLAGVAECYREHNCPDVVHGNVVSLDVRSGKQTISRPDVTLGSLYFGQPLKHGSVFVSRAGYEKYGLFDLRYKCAMDYDIILRMILMGATLAYLDRPIAVIRNSGVNVKQRSLTRKESCDISIRHGCQPWLARLYLSWKVIKDVAKLCLEKGKLVHLLNGYRWLRGNNVPFNQQERL